MPILSVTYITLFIVRTIIFSLANGVVTKVRFRMVIRIVTIVIRL